MMRNIVILGLVTLFVLLALPGAVSAADVSVSGSVVDEDLSVTAISPNVGAGAAFFANEPNVISVTVTNSGGLDAAASTVEVVVGTDTYTAAVPAIAAGASATVTVTDTVSRTYASGPVSVTATADSAGVISESNEANNAMTSALTIYYNGYKGKRWTPELGGDMTTQYSVEGRYDVKYSAGNSAYKSAKWLTSSSSWSSSDLPVPSGATVVSARLYQGYSYNKMASDPAFTGTINGNALPTPTKYKDIKGFGSYSFPYGLYVYDVTSQFNTAGNSLTLTPEGTPGTTNDYALYGAYIIVTYSDPAATDKQIFINDEFDMVSSTTNAATKYSTNDAEATVYAPFAGVSTTDMASAKAIAIVASSSSSTDVGKSKFFFNSNEYTGFWADYLTSPQIGFSVYDIAAALASGANEARLQSYDSGAGGDNFYAMNTILIVEKSEGAVGITSLGASTTSGDAPLSVTFTPVTSGYIASYAWDFDNDGDTDSTAAAPTNSYTTAGTYSVKLTVTGAGAGNTATKTETDYITVMVPAPVVDFTGTPTSGQSPLTVEFTATNTGGAVNSYDWTFGDGQTQTTTGETVSHTYTTSTAQTYSVSLLAHGPDSDSTTVTKSNYISVGAQIIDVTVSQGSIDFGTMAAGTDETGSTTVSVDVTGGTAWSVTAAANNGGYMKAGALQLANPFQLSNDGTNFQSMTSNFANFITGSAGVDGSDTANVKQAIGTGDQPGSYSITLTFTGSMA